MNECQVWWTLTGNFGNMMPIDWSKTYTRAHHLPTLNLCDPRPPGMASKFVLYAVFVKKNIYIGIPYRCPI